MNENFKFLKSVQNDVNSVCNRPRSAPAKFRLSRVPWRGVRGLIHFAPNVSQGIRDFCISLGTVN